MEEIQVNEALSLAAPNGAFSYSITHEWGDVVSVGANNSANHVFTYTPDSIGVHKIQWYSDYPLDSSGLVSATKVGKPTFYQVYLPVIDIDSFLEENPTLEELEDDLPKIERLIRHQIQNYTGQKFGPYTGLSLDIQGDGGEALQLPTPISSLESILNSYGDDITDMVEICPNERTLLQRATRFKGAHYYEVKRDVFWNSYELFNERYNFTITGDWGYEYVPQEVTEAAQILIAEIMSSDDISEMRTKGVLQMQLGDFMLRLNADQWGTTGNSTADNLLASFVTLAIGLV